MSHLQLSSITLDLLADLLRRPTFDPDSPTLPTGSRTAAALDRAVHGWRSARRTTEDSLRRHLAEIHAVALRAYSHDAATARRLTEMMR